MKRGVEQEARLAFLFRHLHSSKSADEIYTALDKKAQSPSSKSKRIQRSATPIPLQDLGQKQEPTQTLPIEVTPQGEKVTYYFMDPLEERIMMFSTSTNGLNPTSGRSVLLHLLSTAENPWKAIDKRTFKKLRKDGYAQANNRAVLAELVQHRIP